jgi:L-aminopeptidase/D-esterase-like protein
MTGITDVAGIRVGHWTGAHSGVTVVLCPPGTVGSGEVRGGAPATREVALLDPSRSVEHVDAVVLTGGSAFGLASAHGVVEWLAEHGRGFPTRGGPVPIVPAAAIYDLAPVLSLADGAGESLADGAGEPADMAGEPPGEKRVGPEEGRSAVIAADASGNRAPIEAGRVGAGRGATIGKWRGPEYAVPGGLGTASGAVDGFTVGALAVVNAVGDVVAADGTVLAGASAPAEVAGFPDLPAGKTEFEATTLVVIATDAPCSKLDCFLLAQSGHHGLARAIHPSHSRHDGDVVIALATGAFDSGDGDRHSGRDPRAGSDRASKGANLDRLRVLATDVVAAAIRHAVSER